MITAPLLDEENEPLPATQYQLSPQEKEVVETARAFRSPLLLAQKFDKGYQAAKHLNVIDWEFRNHLVNDSVDILVLAAPVRHGKSLYLSKWAPAWYHLRHPHKNTITTSHTSSMALSNSAWVRDKVHELCPLVNLKGVDPGKSAKSYWGLDLPGGGECRAAGVGGAITGFSAHLLTIDDYLKDARAAYSKGERDKQWDWFLAAASTRLEPGGKCVILSCLTGDSQVMRPNGSVTALKGIRPGDRVATFDRGRLVASNVLNHASVGHDDVFTMTLESGKRIRGNARHPFLVEANGGLEWARLRELKVGMKIVCVSSAKSLGTPCRDASTTTINQGEKAHGYEAIFMESGLAQPAWLKDATRLYDAKGTAMSIMQKSAENLALRHQVKTQKATASQGLSIDTESHLSSLMRCLQIKEVCAVYVKNRQLQTAISAEEISALTTAMRLELSGGSSATSAIWLPDTLERHQGPVSLLNTSEFTSEAIVAIDATGFEEVFDMEVEHTGNFIANGMVTHNTRWHEDDLIGRILTNRDKYGLRVRSVTLPALKEDDGKRDPIGRKTGEALWPERWPVEVLERRKKISAIWWSALYQGRPASEGTNEFPEEYFKNIWLNDDEWPERYPLLSASYLDPSKAKNDKKDDYQALVYVGYHNGHIIVDSDIDRIPVTKMLRKWIQWDRERRPKISGCEGNAFQELLIGEYNDVCKEEGYNHDSPECVINTISKIVRIRRVGPWLSRGLLKFRRTRSNEILIEQLKEFPNGGKDDGPDALDGALRLLLKLLGKEFEESVTETSV